MATKPTHEQAQLHLQVYDQRREARLRQAREWFFKNYIVDTLEDFRPNIKGQQEFPPNQRELRECAARFGELNVTGMLRGRLRLRLRYSLGQRIA